MGPKIDTDTMMKDRSGKFNFTDVEFLHVINRILKTEVSADGTFIPLENMEDSFNLHGLDSLSTMMFFVWIAEFFGITEEKLQELAAHKNFTITTLKKFVMENATRTFTYEEGAAYAEKCL
jgi:acyl carrier protein